MMEEAKLERAELDVLSEEEIVEEDENFVKRPTKKSKVNWGYDKGEKIFKLKNLRFKPFTTAVTEEEKYGEGIALTGNLYVREFIEHLPEGAWRMKYYEKPFVEYCVQGQFLEGITSVEMTDIDVIYDLIYHIVENEKVFGGIKLVRLRNCHIMDEQLKILCPRLGNAYVLHELDLSHNPIGDEGLIVIVKYLPLCASLRILNLFDTQITPVGLEKFGHAYGKQQILLTKLNIGRNRLASHSSIKKFLGGIMKKSAPLEELLMANCTLTGAETAANFESILSLSDSLRYIDISFNLFSTEEELLPIISLFARSNSIKEMVLNFNPIPDSVLTTMLDYLFEFPKLEIHKKLYLENMTMPQVYFREKWSSFNRSELVITSGGVRKIKLPKIDTYKQKLVKRFNFLYKKKKSKKDMVISIIRENLPPRNLKRVKADDFKDALMAVGKIDFLLIQEIVNEFSGGGSRANAQEFIDIYNELFPPKPKIPKKSAPEKNKKKDKKSSAQVRVSEVPPSSPSTTDINQ
nr:uncharacterized protein LOC106680584 [Halyomorpha halys]